MKTRLTLLSALLIVGLTALYFFYRGGGPDNQLATAGGHQWLPGAKQSYRLAITSRVRLKLPMPATTRTLDQEISGVLGMRVFSREAGRVKVGFQLNSASYTLNGQRDEALLKNLEQPFVVTFEPNGNPLSYRFPEGHKQTERTLLEELIRTFQLVFPEEPRTAWTSSEEHATGRYLAHYNFRDDGVIQKKKTLYTDLYLSSPEEPDEPPTVHLKQSLGTFKQSGQSSWIHSAVLSEKVSFIGAGSWFTESEVRAKLELLSSAPGRDAPTLFDVGSIEGLFAAPPILVAEDESALHPAAALPSGEQGEAAQEPSTQSRSVPVEVLAKLVDELNWVDKAERIALLKRIEEFLEIDPELSYWLIAQVRGANSTGATDAWLIHLLERSSTPQAQEALSMAMADPTYRHWNRVQAAVALGGVENPTDEALVSLLDITRNRGSAEEMDLSNAALLAVGSLGKNLAGKEPDRAELIGRELTASLGQAWDPIEAAMVLKAMENMGDPVLGAAIRPYLEDEEPFVRSAAAGALGRVRGEGATDLLTERLSLEEDRQVRSSIVIAMEQAGNVSADSLASVKQLVLEEPEANTRYHMTKYLGDSLEDHPENRRMLQILAMKDPSSRVRQYANKVLLEAEYR